MKLDDNIKLPLVDGSSDYIKRLVQALFLLLRDIHSQVNGVTYGQLSALPAMTSPPAAGNYGIGDEVPNVNRGVVLGSTGSKYTLHGWVCTSSSPLTWAEQRMLTGG